MNRKNKVIVSIVGITIVLLALLGITYAYYLTRIQGNTNTNSISITTADLKLEYGDGTTQILTKENIVPDNNNPVGTKDFTVSNTGNTTIENYKVVLEYAVIDGVVPSVFKYPNDFEITLTCVSKNIETNEISGTCSGAELKWDNESVVMVTNNIDSKIRHEYSLEIYYKDSGIDQSDDMGKNLNLKVQIYGENETSTITGTIDNVDETYAMKLNSNPKISTIKKLTDSEGKVKYQYKFIGVEPNTGNDSHTLTLVNKSNVEQSTGNITIKKGTNANIDGSTITVKDNQTNIYLTTSGGNTNLTSGASFNPYSNNTDSLAYHILNNSINKINGTEYRDKPLTNPAISTSGQLYKTDEVIISETERTEQISVTNQERYWTYATNYIVDEKTGKFNLIEPKTCKYNESGCISDLINTEEAIYVVSSNSYNNSDSTATLKPTTNLSFIYLITSAPTSSNTSITIKYKQIFPVSYSTEKILSMSKDDFGTSYYYRGGVIDNYLNFAGMCWRIVRIEGDGSVKLILEDETAECSSATSSKIDTSIIGSGVYNLGYGDDINESFDYDSTDNKSNSMKYKMNIFLNGGDFQTNNSSGETIIKSYPGISNDLKSKLKFSSICIGDLSQSYSKNGALLTKEEKNSILNNQMGVYYFEAITRVGTTSGPSLVCGYSSKKTNLTQIFPLTVDEAVFAGGAFGKQNESYYLTDNTTKEWWTITPGMYYSTGGSAAYYVSSYIQSSGLLANTFMKIRPAISLIPGIQIISGNGTLEYPYIVN